MTNTWLHSALVIALAIPVLLLASLLRVDPPAPMMVAPLAALSLLAPGLLLGWFTRRHPLVVGALAGAIAAGLGRAADLAPEASPSLAGDMVHAAMVVAVAALAGRALRQRFRPGHT